MDINKNEVLDMLNRYIISERLNKSQILQMATLVAISNNLSELKENLNWEELSYKH